MPAKNSTTTSHAMQSGPTEVLNISNFRSPLSAPHSTSATNGAAQSPKQQTPEPLQPVNGVPGNSSSKVIQKLTADNDRLRRELRAEKAAKDEALEELRAQKNLFASLQSQTSNLEHIHGNDKLLTERKDRRIAQLRESLDVETARRLKAEDTAKEACDQLEQVHTGAQKEVAEAQLAAKRADAAYEALRHSYTSLQTDISCLRADMHEIHDHNRAVNHRIERVSLISDERDRHQASATHINGQLRKRLNDFQARDEHVARLEKELEEAILAMRWVVKLHGPKEGEVPKATSVTQESPTRPTRKPPPRPR